MICLEKWQELIGAILGAIISILLGFFLDKFLEARRKKEIEKEFLISLYTDLIGFLNNYLVLILPSLELYEQLVLSQERKIEEFASTKDRKLIIQELRLSLLSVKSTPDYFGESHIIRSNLDFIKMRSEHHSKNLLFYVEEINKISTEIKNHYFFTQIKGDFFEYIVKDKILADKFSAEQIKASNDSFLHQYQSIQRDVYLPLHKETNLIIDETIYLLSIIEKIQKIGLTRWKKEIKKLQKKYKSLEVSIICENIANEEYSEWKNKVEAQKQKK